MSGDLKLELDKLSSMERYRLFQLLVILSGGRADPKQILTTTAGIDAKSMQKMVKVLEMAQKEF